MPQTVSSFRSIIRGSRADSGSDPTTADYVRTARRLRARHGRDLHFLHRALNEAASDFDRRRAGVREARDLPSPVETFERVVARRVHEPVLRYSVRLELVSLAEQLGVGRFEANLIIVTRQHRSRESAPIATRDETTRSSRSNPTQLLGACALVVALQSIIVWGAYHVVALTK